MRTPTLFLIILALAAPALAEEMVIFKKQEDEPMSGNTTVCTVSNQGSVVIVDKDGSINIQETGVPMNRARLKELIAKLPAKPSVLKQLSAADMKRVKTRWSYYPNGSEAGKTVFLRGETKGYAMLPANQDVEALGQEFVSVCAAAYRQAKAHGRHRPF
jgi:hypothetical protein